MKRRAMARLQHFPLCVANGLTPARPRVVSLSNDTGMPNMLLNDHMNDK
jgi:hypothetical protein